MSIEQVIDTSVWLEYFAGSEKAKKIIENGNIGSSIITLAELADKFEREDREFESALNFIIASATILPVTVEIAILAAKLKKQIRKKHSKFGLADALHLASAKSENAIFVTTDNDFAGVNGALVI